MKRYEFQTKQCQSIWKIWFRNSAIQINYVTNLVDKDRMDHLPQNNFIVDGLILIQWLRQFNVDVLWIMPELVAIEPIIIAAIHISKGGDWCWTQTKTKFNEWLRKEWNNVVFVCLCVIEWRSLQLHWNVIKRWHYGETNTINSLRFQPEFFHIPFNIRCV